MNWGMKVMANKVSSVNDYRFTSDDRLFLDTNIWMFVYGPQSPRNTRVETYSQVLSRILTAKCRIYIDVLIVSEFINTYSRLRWNILGKPQRNFKQFRKSEVFKSIAQDIAADVRRVLSHCERLDSGFDSLDINSLIAEYATGDADFNDQVIAVLCRRKGLKLVTDDGDFRGQDIPVVTANRHLLGESHGTSP